MSRFDDPIDDLINLLVKTDTFFLHQYQEQQHQLAGSAATADKAFINLLLCSDAFYVYHSELRNTGGFGRLDIFFTITSPNL